MSNKLTPGQVLDALIERPWSWPLRLTFWGLIGAMFVLGLLAGVARADVPPNSGMANWISSLPQDYVGTFYATYKTPGVPLKFERKVEAWGQLCDGTDQAGFVEDDMYNNLPFHGKGFTYVSWRCVPDNPKLAKLPLVGVIKNPKPYSGSVE
jgi:hypothetical protein